MAELLVAADAEVAAVDELEARLTAPIGTRTPSPRPAVFGRVLCVGGAQRDLVTDAFTLTLEGFGDTETKARDLCALMLGWVQRAARVGTLGGVPCYGATAASLPANLPMPSVPDRFRFTATVTIDLRRTAA